MKVIIVDDEQSMRLVMKNMLSKMPDIEVAGTFASGAKAFDFLKENKTDLAFVDIGMPGESGIDFARRVASEIADTRVIFLTAYKEYALEAFEVQAFDYLVKPVSQARLENSIQRARQRFVPFQSARETASPYKLLVYCFGGLEAGSEDGRRVRFASSKSSELLAYLLIRNGKMVSKWSILEDVFRGMPPQNAETYLNTTVYKLRKALEPFGMKSAVISAEESYRIDTKDIYIDLIDFESRVGGFSEFNPANQEHALKTEMLYTGELFGEKDYYWSLPQKERLSEVYWSFAIKLARYLLSTGQLAASLDILKKLVFMNELDEEVNCLLMRVYAHQKNRVSLERQYDRYKKALRRELGISPENKVAGLYSKLITDMN